ncbi:MAG: hypothetical protein RI922_2122 [Bacteroidota bacterium]|jgi:uncharacterized protein YndB with AHSA1/START domain
MITVKTTIHSSIEQVWSAWTSAEHITQWTFASDDWHAPYAEIDLKVGGRFKTTMAAKDESFSFDFSGTFTEVAPMKKIAYTLDDDRKVVIEFTVNGKEVTVVESFDPESVNSLELQETGWQMILNNFKKHVDSLS